MRAASGVTRSSRVLELRDVVNSDAVSPGAIIALSLMYLKSGDQSAARKLKLPQLSFELEDMRPDILLFRTVGRNLILWNDIKPTDQWISEQIPQVPTKVMIEI